MCLLIISHSETSLVKSWFLPAEVKEFYNAPLYRDLRRRTKSHRFFFKKGKTGQPVLLLPPKSSALSTCMKWFGEFMVERVGRFLDCIVWNVFQSITTWGLL